MGLIRAATRTIHAGVREIDAQLSQVRGPLSKKAIRLLGVKIKELRQTAESAEHAFRDWTVDLTGRPGEGIAEKVEYDALRLAFESEVEGIQRSMLRVADEVKRLQVSKAAGHKGADQEALEVTPAAELAPEVEPERQTLAATHEAEVAPSTRVADAIDDGAGTAPRWNELLEAKESVRWPDDAPETPRGSVWQRAPEAVHVAPVAEPPAHKRVVDISNAAHPSPQRRASSHQKIATVLSRIESQEQEMQVPCEIIARGVGAESQASPPSRQKGRGPAKCNPWMKYLVFCALVTLSWAIWGHARYLVLSTSGQFGDHVRLVPVDVGEPLPPVLARPMRPVGAATATGHAPGAEYGAAGNPATVAPRRPSAAP